MCYEAFKNLNPNEYKIYLKLHPILNYKRLIKKINIELPHNFIFSNENTISLLKNSKLLITGMSSIALESMALGIPVITINNSQGLNYNPILDDKYDNLWKSCSSIDEINKKIIYFKNRNKKELNYDHKLALDLRNQYFKPVTRKAVLKFLEIS